MNHEIIGIVHGTTIELAHDPGIPDGAEVLVTVRRSDQAAGASSWGEGIRRSAGVAANVEGFDEAFAQIERDRKAATFRDSPIVMSFLLDTNICSAHMRRPGGLAHRFIQHSGRLWTSTLVLAELYAGAYSV